MMRLLAPLGLIGLLGVVALIIIYIIKPNYQQRYISSTFVWKLSLKYRKRKLPINKLRNILIIICQILILTLAAFILSRPNTVFDIEPYKQEYVLVIDSSASMRTTFEGETRFERAVKKAIEDAYLIFEEDGLVTVIIADGDPAYLQTKPEEDEGIFDDESLIPEVETFLQVTSAKSMSLEDELNRLVDDNECYYGESDIDAAMLMCQSIIDENPTAKVYLYTDTEYNTADTVKLINVTHEDEWNAGVLDVRTAVEDYYYSFEVDVGFYAKLENPQDVKSALLNVQFNVNNANAYDKESDEGINMARVDCEVRILSGQTRTIVFKCGLSDTDTSDQEEEGTIYFDLEQVYGKDVKIQTFGSATVKVTREDATGDSNNLDDMFIVYGNQKNIVKVQYASSLPNPFMSGVIESLQDTYSNRWDIKLTEVKKGDDFATSGFDLYIYEHEMPDILPTDGAVVMVNPDKAPPAANFTLSQEVQGTKNYYLHTEELEEDSLANSLLKGMTFENVFACCYQQITSQVGYDVLATINNTPAVMVSNVGEMKLGVIAFSVHNSNFTQRKEYPVFWTNLFAYFFPTMLENSSVQVGENLEMNSMSDSLEVFYPINVADGENLVFDMGGTTWNYDDESLSQQNYHVSMPIVIPGVYNISQHTYHDRNFDESIFVSIPAAESNIWNSTQMEAPIAEKYETEYFEDWLLYLAAIIVFLLFAEWWLHTRENKM